jgi:hypothetical protein
MSSTNRGAERSHGDFYATPAWLVDALMPLIPMGAKRIIDAGAGTGAITMGLVRAGVPAERITAIDIKAPLVLTRGVRYLTGDFLEHDEPYDLCVMNPPYETETCTAYDFVEHAITLTSALASGRGLRGTVAALLRVGWLEGARKGEPARYELLKHQMPDVHITPFRPSFDDRGTDSATYAWMLWGHGLGGRIRMLETSGRRVRADTGPLLGGT